MNISFSTEEKEKEENLGEGIFLGRRKRRWKIFREGKYLIAMKKKNGEGKYHGEGKIVADLRESKALRCPRGPKSYLKRLALILKRKNI